MFKQTPALLRKILLDNNKQSITNVTSNPQGVNNRETISTAGDVHSISNRDKPLPEMDLMNDSVIYNRHDDDYDDEKVSISYNTEDEYEDEYSYTREETKSLYSNAPEEEQERLIELQLVNKHESYNVDDKLSNIYMKKYRRDDDTNELIEKGRILFGTRYNGPTQC